MAEGKSVVLMMDEGALPVVLPERPPAGRLSVFVGDPTDERTRQAAWAMDAELHGAGGGPGVGPTGA